MVVVGDDVAVGKTQSTIVGRRSVVSLHYASFELTCVKVGLREPCSFTRSQALSQLKVGLWTMSIKSRITPQAEWRPSALALNTSMSVSRPVVRFTRFMSYTPCLRFPALLSLHQHCPRRKWRLVRRHNTCIFWHLTCSPGMGIHNENGVKRMSPVPPLDDLVEHLLDFLTSTADPDRSYLPFRGDGTDRVILMVNNLGGVSELELNAVVHSVTAQLSTRRFTLIRILVGTFMVCLFLLHMSVSD
jgi:hypothetical protein